MPPWKMPKRRAMSIALIQGSCWVVMPLHTETAKQSAANPMANMTIDNISINDKNKGEASLVIIGNESVPSAHSRFVL